MRRREVIVLIGTALVAHPGWAQLPVKKRIGFLRVGEPPLTWIASFREGLREFGLIEGQHFTIEFGLAQSTAEVPEIAAGLVRRNVDVLVAGIGTGGTITGISRYFKLEKKKKLLSVGVEPESSPVITQTRAGEPLRPGPTGIQGIGAGFIPDTLDLKMVDRVELASDEESIVMARVNETR